MKCPICGVAADVKETRLAEENTVRRRHECLNGHRFTTYEVYASTFSTFRREIAATARRVAANAVRWKRDLRIARDLRGASVVAREHDITEARVRQIRAARRAPAPPGIDPKIPTHLTQKGKLK